MAHRSQRDNTATQKRLACDRCHLRKMRCFRDASTAKCTRCIQLGCSCTYSPPLKSGRPRKTSSAARKTTPSRESLSGMNSNTGSLSSSSIDESIKLNNHPSSYPMQPSAVDDQIYLPSQDPYSLHHHIGSMPAAYPENLSFKWMELSLAGYQDMNNSPDQQQHHDQAQPINITTSSETDLECDSVPDPIACSQSVSNTMAEVMCSLSRLQHELVNFRIQWNTLSDDSGPNVGPQAFSPVKSTLKPGQELIDMICQVLNECFSTRSGCRQPQRQPAHFGGDQRTILSLIFTPLSLLLSAYGDLLRDIRTVWNRSPQPRNRPDEHSHRTTSYPNFMSNTSSLGEILLDDDDDGDLNQNQQEEQSLNETRCNDRNDSTSLIPDNLQLTLDTMPLNQPLQLVLLATVVKHHLTCLADALQGLDLQIAESRFVATISELRKSITIFLSEAQSILSLIN